MVHFAPPVNSFAPRRTLPHPGILSAMTSPIALIGVGEMGSVFSHALLRSGRTVVPVLRSTPIDAVARRLPDPEMALVTVGEDDLGPVLDRLPAAWRSRVGLIQNELLPRDWSAAGVSEPTVAVVWFEKKPHRPLKVIVPTPVAGPGAALLAEALSSIDIPVEEISDDRLTDALVAKNLYILTTNIAGLRTSGTVSDLWRLHRPLAIGVAAEILEIQEWLVGAPIDRDRAVEGMVLAFEGDPEHGTTGRSAPHRLERALRTARAAGIDTPILNEIGREAGLTV